MLGRVRATDFQERSQRWANRIGLGEDLRARAELGVPSEGGFVWLAPWLPP
jgi:hypothetical protein